ncbi:MAG: hypothetical protein KJ715_06780 [Gammaproteobacteria bacterium]|nr:hypothetical protein [Gammaproteobacteria bacterium]
MSNSIGATQGSSQVQLSRDYLRRLFTQRPTLAQVAESMIQDWINDWFTASSLRASSIWVGVRQSIQADGARYAQLTTLSDALITRCMSGKVLNYVAGHHEVLVSSITHGLVPLTDAVSVDDIELMLNALAPELLDGFNARLLAYWNAPTSGNTGLSRWGAVGRQLRKCLLIARQNPPLTAEERTKLLGLGDGPQELWAYQADRQALGGAHVLRIYQVYAGHEGQTGEWLPLLVLQRQVAQQQVNLVYVPAMSVLKLGMLDELGDLLPRYMSNYISGQSVKWVLREPQGDVFDAQAQALLERQFRALKQVDWSALPYVDSYKRLLHKLTDPAVWFDAGYVQQPHEEQLPIWLQVASAADRQTYGQWLERLAHLQKRTGGASFLDGLDPIDVYARKALQRQMRRDYPQEVAINPDDYLLTFERTQGATVGWTQRSANTLTLWSLENPFATPYASVQISHQAAPGQMPAGWIKPAYLKKLIEKVDVGKHYPALLKQALVSDPVESARRRGLFVEQMALQLPLGALENCLRRRNGFTPAGAEVVQALLHKDPLRRTVGNQVIIARPLAFLTHAGGVVHKASNLFIIGPRDNSALPHILYRPDQAESALQQFSSRQALLDEITRTGSDLQVLVLERLTESSRALFGNGGFLSPHVQRFLQGDEYSEQPAASPALLSDEPVPGVFLEAVFDENARSLWQVAQKRSISDEALRWTLFKNNLWQIFNALLPMLRGLVAVAGWLSQVYGSFRAVLALPAGATQEDRANALAELLGSLAGLLLSPVVNLDERLRLSETKPLRISSIETTPARHVQQTPSTFAWQRSLADVTGMDFSWANSRFRLDPAQQAQLESFRWSPGRGEQWPGAPTITSPDSPVRGRVAVRHADGTVSHEDYLLIDSQLYGGKQVDGRWQVVDLRSPQRSGPWLRKDSHGVWKVDLGLQLLGGHPKLSAASRRANIQRQNQMFERHYEEATARLLMAESEVAATEDRFKEAHGTDPEKLFDQSLQDLRDLYLIALEKQSRAQFDKLDALIAKNANKPVERFEPEKILQLEDLVENLRVQMAMLITKRSAEVLPSERRSQLNEQLEHDDVAVVQAAHHTLVQATQAIIDYNEKLIDLSILERNNYARLVRVPGYNSQSGALSLSTLGTPLDWKSLQLKALGGVIVRRPPLPEEYDDFIRIGTLIDEAIQSVHSQKDLQEAGPLSVQQRIDGYGAILLEYDNTQASLREYGDMASDLLFEGSIDRLNRMLNALEHEAQGSLAALLRERERTPTRAPGPSLVSGKRLVRDRKSRYLVGQVRARTPQANEDIVDVINPVDQSVVASFRQAAGSDEFEEITEASTLPVRPVRSLQKLKEDARKLLARQSTALEQARSEARVSRLPVSVEARLLRHAGKIDAVADRIRKTPAQEKAPEALQPLLKELAQASSRLVEHGRLIRIEMVKRLAPDEEGIAYLKSQNEVQILTIEGRIALKREHDFLQEYVVKDMVGKVLAYAHFHYRTREAPSTEYSAGHLKKPGQRFMSFRSLADKTDSDVIAVYYSRISAAMAQQLFFSAKEAVIQRGRRVFW